MNYLSVVVTAFRETLLPAVFFYPENVRVCALKIHD